MTETPSGQSKSVSHSDPIVYKECQHLSHHREYRSMPPIATESDSLGNDLA